jgi:hypothetical protein
MYEDIARIVAIARSRQKSDTAIAATPATAGLRNMLELLEALHAQEDC